jgi:hypothetical protein
MLPPLASRIRSRGSKANLRTDGSLASVKEDKKAEGEIRKSELFFRFPLSDFRFFSKSLKEI